LEWSQERQELSFTAEVKEDLARLFPSRPCCRMAELSALLHLEGSLHLRGAGGICLHTESENAAVARKIFVYLKEGFGIMPELRVEKPPRLRGHNCYSFFLDHPGLPQVLNELGLLDDSMRPLLGVSTRITRRRCCGISYLRGAFLGGGYVSRPDQPAHLEINVQHLETAEGIRKLMERYSIKPQLGEKRRFFSVYVKSRRDQSDFLALIGAHSAVLRLQSDAVIREIRGVVNRRVNSETANLGRMVDAAQRQITEIRLIQEELGLEALPPALREIARARLENPDCSLRELGAAMRPPLSKAAVYHRLLRIREVASGLAEGRGNG